MKLFAVNVATLAGLLGCLKRFKSGAKCQRLRIRSVVALVRSQSQSQVNQSG